ncbi:MAG: hypothetical protein E6J05_03810 [Chloroflexi bacterium]|nr:MAG: hypothetical protein E6J05_03810 [Chloroflexota bacterium]
MNDFDRRLEAGLAQMLDSVVRTPPPRRRPRRRLALHPLSLVTMPVAQQDQRPVADLVDAGDRRVDAIALAEVPVVAAPALV